MQGSVESPTPPVDSPDLPERAEGGSLREGEANIESTAPLDSPVADDAPSEETDNPPEEDAEPAEVPLPRNVIPVPGLPNPQEVEIRTPNPEGEYGSGGATAEWAFLRRLPRVGIDAGPRQAAIGIPNRMVR
jgi:hypothetical protein